jgi:dTDP-4-dehydrorhamnose reductase
VVTKIIEENKLRTVVIGANGQLGSEIYRQFEARYDVTGLTHEQIEISDIDNAHQALQSLKPDIVINTAAYHHVADCEKNPHLAFEVNAIGVLNLVKLSNDLKFKLIHFSTDYVFDGMKNSPYTEHDIPNPLNIYALSKLNGEIIIKNYCERYFIIRISGIYGKVPCRAKGGNFIHTMIKAAKEKDIVKVVNDEVLSPTSVYEIALLLPSLIHTDVYGLYHCVCRGECSWYDFAAVIFNQLNLKTPLQPCSSDQFPAAIKRPCYSALENYNLKALNLDNMSFWKDALIKFLADNFTR